MEFTTTLIEAIKNWVNGKLKNKISSINSNKPDENGNVDIEISWNDLTDKPFYDTIEEATKGAIVELTTVTSSGQAVNGPISPNNNILYKVYFDQETFICTTILQGTGFDGIAYLGNLSLCNVGEDNNLPFCLKQTRYSSIAICYVQDSSISHTLKAVPLVDGVKTIDEKYLPESVTGIEEVQGKVVAIFDLDEGYGGFSDTINYPELKAALESNKIVLFKKTISSRPYFSLPIILKEEGVDYVIPTQKGVIEGFFPKSNGMSSVSYQSTYAILGPYRLENWEADKTGSVEYIPSINTMEQYVALKTPSKISQLENDSNFVNKTEVENLQDKIDILNGNGEGSVKNTVTEAVATIVANAPEDFDTLKEVATWIENDTLGTADLLNRISAAEKNIETLDVQSDWKQTDETSKDYIKNKPAPMTDDEIDAICGTSLVSNDIFVDENTNIVYKLYVEDGKLHMKEVE